MKIFTTAIKTHRNNLYVELKQIVKEKQMNKGHEKEKYNKIKTERESSHKKLLTIGTQT